MNSLQIQYFLTVADLGSFTEAAGQLFVSQPAVSKQIRLLEKELGTVLFERTGKNIRLTRPGQAYYDYFLQCGFYLDLLQNRLRAQKESGLLPIRVSYLEGLNPSYFLPQMKDAAAAIAAPIRLVTSCYALPQLLDALRTGETDMIFTFGSILTGEQFHAEPLIEIPRVLLYSAAAHPEPVPDIRAFRHDIFFLPEEGHVRYMEQTLRGIFLNHGFSPQIEYAPNFTTIMDRVERGEGVFVYNAWCRYCSQPAFRFLPLPETQMLYLTRKESTAAPELLNFLEEFKKRILS